MAEIKPFRAWRYAPDAATHIDELTSPLFDVVSEKQRRNLYSNPHNSIHLSVPQGPNPTQKAAQTLQAWKDQGIIEQDPLPGIYVYYQYFTLPGSDHEYCRKGFIANIKAYDWPEKVVLRHENTMPNAVNDRIDLLDATQLNVSPTHGLYTDPAFTLETFMDQSMQDPIYETEDYQGVRDVLSVIHDASVIQQFMDLLQDKQIILADGHHRYESSIIYRKRSTQANPNHTGQEGYNYHLMFFTNTEAHDLRILPTHRLISGLPNFSEAELMQKLAPYFTIKPIEDAYEVGDIILGKPWAFGLLFQENTYKVMLKPEVLEQLNWKFPDIIKRLDLTVMHYFIIEKGLGIPGKAHRNSSHISFDRSLADCLAKVIRQEAQMAIITKDISMEQVKEVCYSGYTLPQKSTYFYPKVICGFLFSSIHENEFANHPDSIF